MVLAAAAAALIKTRRVPRVCVYVRLYVCVCVCARVSVRVCVCLCVYSPYTHIITII